MAWKVQAPVSSVTVVAPLSVPSGAADRSSPSALVIVYRLEVSTAWAGESVSMVRLTYWKDMSSVVHP